MKYQRHQLLNDLERITGEIAGLKKIIILEFKPSSNGKNKAAWDDLKKSISELSNKWDNLSASEEIRRQREK
ncbi:hypothetical protein ACFL52_00780 [Candidatus Margulisiibacteriota bacterium]